MQLTEILWSDFEIQKDVTEANAVADVLADVLGCLL